MGDTPSHKYTVLIVDDLAENIQVLSNMLYERGVNIAIAQSGHEALQIAAKKAPDLILLDIMMPDMDGFAVCEQLQQQPQTCPIPIIFLTARVQPEDVVKGFACGAVDYVTKPFNSAELLSRVFTHLELKRARDTITAQNQRLAEQNQLLHEANISKDKFFSILAHDLRNPFNALLALTTLLKDEWSHYGPDEITRYLDRIQQAAERSYTLLENLLEWSRSQAGRLRFTPQKVSVNMLVDESIRVLEHQAHVKNIAVSVNVPEHLEVQADVKMLTTIVRNLLSNAIKFTPPGGRVIIDGQAGDDGVRVCVRDTGVGIKPGALAQLFRIDAHHTTTGTADERGSGLGLILCKEFTDRHGGALQVHSEPGAGSTFTVILPQSADL
jgi:two-component system, sensor histidine kinase and response regulator